MKIIPLLKKLISIPSVFPHEKTISKYIINYLRNTKFKVKIINTQINRPNIIATFGKSNKFIAFYGHLDTVPPEMNYPQDPFTLKIHNKIATGLGVADMKGGIAAILRLGSYAAQNNLPIKIIFGVDEENISQGAHDLVSAKVLNDIGFLIVAESGQIKKYNQPFSLCYGRKGRILFDVLVSGKKAHAAESQKAINAIEKTALLINQIKKISLPKDKYFGSSEIVIHSITGGTDSFSIPDSCNFQLSLLTNSKMNSNKFIQIFNAFSKNLNIQSKISLHKRLTPYAESYVVDTNNNFLKVIDKNLLKKLKVNPIYTASVADENIFANFLKIPVITLGPIGGGDHTKNEWLDLKSLDNVITSYKKILQLYHNKQS